MKDQYEQLRKLSDADLLARCIWGEGRGEKVEGKIAIAHVVLNRVKAKSWYGRSISDVILKPFQFSCFNASDPNLPHILKLSSDCAELAFCKAIAELVIRGHLKDDPTGGATHYHAAGCRPSWASKLEYLCQIGNHLFYKETSGRSIDEHDFLQHGAGPLPRGENQHDERGKTMSDKDALSTIQQSGAILEQADDALQDLLDTLDSSAETETQNNTQSTTSSSVAQIAQANQSITNTVSAVSQCVSAAKQNDAKLTQSMTRSAESGAQTTEHSEGEPGGSDSDEEA
ncbi:MAG TPA: cell wall hydrolase [Syntrophobacteraceae bacterium]|nr:cell wall hydrolase [Syntrophobacteraceae bacterium]